MAAVTLSVPEQDVTVGLSVHEAMLRLWVRPDGASERKTVPLKLFTRPTITVEEAVAPEPAGRGPSVVGLALIVKSGVAP